MASIAVAGVVNLETTVPVGSFPIEYSPTTRLLPGQLHTSVSGVGANVAIALARLGHSVRLLGMLADDDAGRVARRTLKRHHVADAYVLYKLAATPQSVVAYDSDGRRSIFSDLSTLHDERFPSAVAAQAFAGCPAVVLSNAEFSRPLLGVAQRQGVPIVTDVHAISDLDDHYNADFLAAADVVFQSGDALPCPPEQWVAALFDRYPARLAVVGMGAEGALLGERTESRTRTVRVPAVRPVPVVSTVGAGDALLAAFVHAWVGGAEPERALRQAVVFAGFAIGSPGGSGGFVDAATLDARTPTPSRY